MYEAGRNTQLERKIKNEKMSETRWLQTGQLRLSSPSTVLRTHIGQMRLSSLSTVLRTHIGQSFPQGMSDPDNDNRGTASMHQLGTCQLPHHHIQVHHQEKEHPLKHHTQ
jgi:hypothetical protein